ncbi:MAG: phospholipase D-like domain-containing protein [Balneolia bacterium]|nr:phospholipase D-like domain-containing protein [Balneolia bacterium]
MTFKLSLKKLILGILSLFLIYLIGTLLFFNATPVEILITSEVEVSHGVKDDQFRIESAQLSGRAWVGGNDIQVLTRGSEIFHAMFNDIGSASRSITKETYNFYGDDVAKPMAEALSEAAERGVQVKFLMDFIGSALAENGLFDNMRDSGVEVERWREPAWYQIARFNHRTHRKLLNIDGRVAYTGGANTADPWLPDHEDGGYKDYHFRITGPVVSEMQGAFAENWASARGELITGPEFFRTPSETGNLLVQVTTSHPREGQKRVRTMLLYAMASAEESIRIGSAYFFPDDKFIDAMLAARQRGVQIQLLMPGETIDQNYVRLASQTLWGPLFEAGVEIYEYNNTMYHAKKMIVDDYFVTVGSTNFDNRSFRLNDETNINILDETFGETMTSYFLDDIGASERITLEEWENRPLLHRIWGHVVARTIGSYL